MFNYEEAFSRNIGWVTPDEQQHLRRSKVAIAGLGGVGGFHLLTLARLGVSRFAIADFDRFDLANFNRQAGAMMSTCGETKLDSLERMARDINPEIEITRFPEGLQPDNIDAFLQDVDVYVDGLDFFVFGIRRRIFAACHERGIPATTAAPLGMGAAVLNFVPHGMSFDEYFCFDDGPEEEIPLRFMIGLSPALLQRPYLVWPQAVNLAQRRGPSTVMACMLCAGFAATEALKMLLKRGDVRAAPHGMQFDAYRNKVAYTWRPGGNRNLVQRFMLSFARRQLKKMQQQASA